MISSFFNEDKDEEYNEVVDFDEDFMIDDLDEDEEYEDYEDYDVS